MPIQRPNRATSPDPGFFIAPDLENAQFWVANRHPTQSPETEESSLAERSVFAPATALGQGLREREGPVRPLEG